MSPKFLKISILSVFIIPVILTGCLSQYPIIVSPPAPEIIVSESAGTILFVNPYHERFKRSEWMLIDGPGHLKGDVNAEAIGYVPPECIDYEAGFTVTVGLVLIDRQNRSSQFFKEIPLDGPACAPPFAPGETTKEMGIAPETYEKFNHHRQILTADPTNAPSLKAIKDIAVEINHMITASKPPTSSDPPSPPPEDVLTFYKDVIDVLIFGFQTQLNRSWENYITVRDEANRLLSETTTDDDSSSIARKIAKVCKAISTYESMLYNYLEIGGMVRTFEDTGDSVAEEIERLNREKSIFQCKPSMGMP